MRCLRVPLDKVPEGEWKCERCVERRAVGEPSVNRLGRVGTGLCVAAKSLLESSDLPKVFCAVASGSVLEARAAAATEIQLLLTLPSRRARRRGRKNREKIGLKGGN